MLSALQGIKILDFTHVYQGPTSTLILGDFGADIIKVERTDIGDWSRSFGPYLKGESLPFISLNRNKRSIAINLKRKEGKEIIYKLVTKSDVIVNNFRPGTMERLSLGYEKLKKINPKIIFAESTGYGRRGIYANRNKPGHDRLGQAIAGLFEFQPGKPPRSVNRSTDLTTGLLLTIGILVAIYNRERSGLGQRVETNLLNGGVFMHLWEHGTILNTTGVIEKPDQLLIEKAINQVFKTKDSYVAVVPLFRHNLLQKISDALGIQDLTSDSRFDTIEKMVRNNKELNEIIQRAFLSKNTDEWIPILETNDILCAQINQPTEAFKDPQVLENEMVQDIKLHKEDEIKVIGTPIKLNKTPGSIRRSPPLLGQHTDEILKEVGYNPSQISELRRHKIVS